MLNWVHSFFMANSCKQKKWMVFNDCYLKNENSDPHFYSFFAS